ncbi:MAG TPA: hypothetical protein VGN06_06270 [Gaiellaceae bacterium]|jgi:hypothetical protein
MQSVLGIAEFVVFILVIVGFAAGITWLVVRLSPPKKPDDAPTPS